MARLPSGMFLIQQVGGQVILSRDIDPFLMTPESADDEEGNQREPDPSVLLRFDPSDANATAQAQKSIYDLEELGPEDKCFAHFWSGYFHAHASG